MVTKTSLSAIRALILLGQQEPGTVLSPRRMAEMLGESPSYMAKITRSLVKAGLLRAEKGVKGGVQLGRQPRQITLLAMVEACQGTLTDTHCWTDCVPEQACAYHQAALELHRAIVEVLSRWTLEHLLKQPRPAREMSGSFPCVLLGHTTAIRPLGEG